MADIEKIIKGCRRYNKSAQRNLYELYAPKMKGICFRYIGDIDTTKDIVQEGFIKVFSNIKKFDQKGSFDGWIKRIFINTAISYLRKNKQKNLHLCFDEVNEASLLDLEDNSNERELNLNPGNSKKENVELVKSADLSQNELMEALQNIPENFRIVFNLFCIEKIRHEEIAEMLGIEVATSRSRLSRARNLIQKELRAICLEKLKHAVYG